MKYSHFLAFLLFVIFVSCNNTGVEYGVEPHEVTQAGLSWYTIEDLEKMKNIQEKKILVDMYTDWCGWCKRMDKQTFTDPDVVKYLNENFVLVKFNAEQREPITFKGETYESIRSGRRRTNKLAIKLLNGRLGYPTLVYLDGSNLEKIKTSPGYKKPNQLLSELENLLASNS